MVERVCTMFSFSTKSILNENDDNQILFSFTLIEDFSTFFLMKKKHRLKKTQYKMKTKMFDLC